jgi:hypothetical protein
MKPSLARSVTTWPCCGRDGCSRCERFATAGKTSLSFTA